MKSIDAQTLEPSRVITVTLPTAGPDSARYSDASSGVERSQSVLGNAAVAGAAINGRLGGLSTLLARSAMQHGFAASDLQQTVGNSAVQRALRSGLIQAKLAISQPGDVYEQEADRVAATVMRMPNPTAPSENTAPGLQRKDDGCESGHGLHPTCTEGQGMVQRKPLFSRISSFVQRHMETTPDAAGEGELRQMTPAENPMISRSVESQLKSTRGGGGQPLSSTARAFFEPRFGMDFSHVRVHTGSDATEMNRAVSAKAFSHGSDIYFGPGSSPTDLELTAHELTHVVQQTSGGAVTSDAEPAVQRAVTTNGGSFDTILYDPVHAPTGAVGERVGANMRLEFLANDLVESTKIGLIQTVKAMKSSVAGGPRDTVAALGMGNPEMDQTLMGPGQVDPGRRIDVPVHPVSAAHPAGRPAPSTSPVYGVGYTTGGMEATLSQGVPTIGAAPTGSQWGSNTKDPVTHAFLRVPARIEDGPTRAIEFAGQTFEHTFEVAALAVEGPIPVNTYLGSVSWGYRSDAAGHSTVAPLALVQAGAPSAQFMGAAALWNAATFHDTGTGAAVPSVDVPVTSLDSGTVAAADMSTPALMARIALIDWQIAGLAAGTDRTNKEFEKRALEAQLPHRNIKVSVHVISTEDWGSDEVYVKLIGSGGVVTTSPTHDLNDGQSHDFLFPVAAFLPLSGAITVRVYDEDWPDSDDHIVDMSFASPWTPAPNSSSMDDANYEVVVAFEH